MKRILSSFLVLLLGLSLFAFSPSMPVVSADDAIYDLVNQMPLEQKIAQMIIPAFRYWGTGDEKENVTVLNEAQSGLLSKYSFGGVILFAQNITDAEQTTKLVYDMQRANLQGGAVSSLFVSIDQEGGYVTRLNTGTQMPGNMALAATGDPENAYMAADVIGNELAVQGINLDFAPVMDVNNNPENPIIGVRSFSDDPQVVASYGSRFIDGLHNNGVLVALKHFPGHGDTNTDSHTGLPMINKTYEELNQVELVPFRSVAGSADFVMTAHIQYPQIETTTYTSKSTGEQVYLPATLSKTILTDILRNDIGFEGVIITDALEMDAIAEHFDKLDSTKLAINAGANMLLIPVDTTTPEGLVDMENYIKDVAALVNEGEISIDNVNDSVYRILKAKSKNGLMYDDSYNTVTMASRITPSVQLAKETVGSNAHHQLEWSITLKAVTSVKNDGAFPITEDKKTLILYPNENQGNSILYALNKLKEDGVSVDTSMITAMCTKDLPDEFIENSIVGYDEIVMISAVSSGEIEKQELTLSLIEKAHENNSKFIVISSQLPYDLACYTSADGLLACYSSKGMPDIPTGEPNKKTYGPNLPATIYTLFGGSTPTGTLPVNIY